MKTLTKSTIISLCLLAGTFGLKAANGTWTNTASGNWSNTANWLNGIVADGSGSTADFSTINITAPCTVTLDAAHTLTTLKFGDVVPDNNWTLSGANILTLAGTTPTINVVNQNAAISSVIAGTAGLTKIGGGTLDLNGPAVNTFTGTLADNAGAVEEDFSNLGTPANLVNSGVVLNLSGGTLNLNGAASGATSQTFASTTFGTGGSFINLTNNGTSVSLTLGAITYPTPTADPVQYSTVGTITTTSVGAGPKGLLWNNYATFGPSDWASTDVAAGTAGTSPYTVLGLGSVSGGYVTTMGGTGQGQNMDLQANYTASGNVGTTTLRFNTPAANNVNVNGKWVIPNAILVTPNMGAVNASITHGNWFANYNTSAGTVWVVQNNTAGYFTNSGGLINDRGGSGALTYVQSGPGTVVQPGTAVAGGGTGVNANGYTGPTYLLGGSTVVMVDADLGAPATAATVTMNGGAIVGNAVVTLDNGSGANPRPITLLGNGGGLAATAGNTLTVDGQISSAAGTGPLVIGIPASAANGNTAGLLPGSGTGTANTTAVNATGTVKLTYPNGVNGNTFYGGVVILGGATLNINSQYALGGADYGGLTFNNGTLQYSSTLASGAAGSALDISGAPVEFAGNGTIDENGQTVACASSIGSGGSGSLTVANSGVAGAGALLLNGGSSYTGGTTVSSGATFGGTGTLAGNVSWNSGAYATFTQGSPMTISGTATLNGTTMNVIASGLTTGTYTLMTASGGITGGSTVNSAPGGSGIVASGYAGTVSISGNAVILTVTQLGVAATWTDANADQNWATGGNWTGGTAPHNPGDAATFGSGGVGLPVILNQNESVGGLTFSNASSYIVSGSDTLTLNNTIHPIPLSVTAGTSNAINAAVSLNGNVTAAVSPGASFAFGSNIVNQSSAETLTVNGGGRMILSGNNSYGPAAGTVGTTLGGATLQVGNNSALGAGDVNVTANSTLQSGAAGLSLPNNLAVAVGHTATVDNNGNTITLGGVISGSGSLATASPGTLNVSGVNNTYAGGTILNAGVLGISADGTTAGGAGSLGVVPATAATDNIILNGGDLLATATLTLHTNRGIGIGSASFASTATTTGLIDAASGQTLIVQGVIAVAGNIGVNNLTVNSGSGNNGTVVLANANTFNGSNVISAGFEQLSNSLALQNSTLNYNNQGGVLDLGSLTAVTLGGLVGSQNLTLANDLAAPVALTIGNNNVSSTYLGNLGDNSLVANLIKNGTGTITIGSGANGGATYTGVTTVNNGTLVLGGNTAMPSITGNLDISGIAGASSLIMADAASATFSGKIEVCYDGGAGNPNAGTLTVQNSAILNAATFAFGNGSRTANGCSATVQNNGTLSVSGIFDLNDNIGGTAQNNVLNLNGGTLAAGNFISSDALAGTHQATINFNGGVLEANASDPGGSTFLPALAGLTVNVLSNGVTINPNGNTITISPAMSGAGGLTNVGAGILNLPVANTYAGATVIANGATLNVINTAGSATGTNTVTVDSGGTLEGTGTVAGNVTWLPGALAAFGTGSTPTPLTIGVATLNNNVVTVNVPGSPLTVGNYTLMNYTAAGSSGVFNATPTITGSGLVSGVQATVATSGGAVILIVTPNVSSDVWDVDANGSWTDASKWSPAVPGNPGDAATLGYGSALRTVTMNANESLGYLQFTNANSFVVANGGHTLTMDNSGAGAYLTVGAGIANTIQTPMALNDSTTVSLLSGSALTISSVLANSPSVNELLTVSGAGTLVLANANSYGPASAGTYGTVLNGGTVQVGNNSALGAGDVNVTGNSVLQSGAPSLILTNNLTAESGATVTLNDNGNTFTLGGVLNGSGGFTKIGAGTLALTNNNSYGGPFVITNGTAVLTGDNSGSSGPVTNEATLQLDYFNAIGSSSVLALNNNSTLQLRADAGTTFNTASLAVQNAADTLNFDARALTSATGNTLTLNGALAFANNSSQTITVTGNSTYTLSLGAISLTSSTSHNPYYSLNFSTLPSGAAAVIAGITSGNWGDYLNFYGGGNVTITGNLANTSNGSLDLFVNNGSTVTLQGSTVKSSGGDAYRYTVQNGTLVLDNSTALINDTTGAGLNTSYFFLGAATNAYYGTAIVPAAGVLVTNNNNYNAAVYLGDANNLAGGLTIAATVTNIVSDGDAGFTNTGTMTIGGQNTSGINTYANPIILGWTANKGKSVSLVAATGGEVDFTGNIQANGSDTTAGITAGNAASTGLVKLFGTNTYGGPTIVSNGVLALANNGFDASINHSSSIYINTGASLDVSGLSSTTLSVGANGFSQALQGSGSVTGGNVIVGSGGTLAPGSVVATGALTVSGGSTTLGGAAVMKLNNAGSPTSDELVCSAVTGGGTLTVTNIGPALVPGNTFHLFSTAVSGFSAVNLPATANGYNYTWNNQLAMNGSISVATAVAAVNTNAATANFKATPSGNTLKFNWAPDHEGWQLYTNAVGLAATSSWFPLAGSASTTNETINIDLTKPGVFYQLRYP